MLLVHKIWTIRLFMNRGQIQGVIRQFGKILKRKKAQNFQKKALFWENKALFRTKYLPILYLLFQNVL